jgi:hypothetical protein
MHISKSPSHKTRHSRSIPERTPGQARTALDVPVQLARVLQDTMVQTADTFSVATPLALPFKAAEFSLRPAIALGEVVANRANSLVHGESASQKFDHLKADDPAFLDDLFNDRSGWGWASNGEAVGRQRTVGRRGFAETRIVFKPAETPEGGSPVQRALNLFRRAWSSENNGQKEGYKGTFELIADHRNGPDEGKFEYNLYPTGKLPVVGGLKVHETQLKALPLDDGGLRVPIALEGGAEGLAYIDIRPQSADSVSIDARFAGVEPGELGELFGPKGYLQNHTLVERGDGNEIPLLGRLTPDNGGILGMVKASGGSILAVGAPGGPSKPPSDSKDTIRLADVPRQAMSIAQNSMKAAGDVLSDHLLTAPMGVPFMVGAAMMTPAVAAAGMFSSFFGRT